MRESAGVGLARGLQTFAPSRQARGGRSRRCSYSYCPMIKLGHLVYPIENAVSFVEFESLESDPTRRTLWAPFFRFVTHFLTNDTL